MFVSQKYLWSSIVKKNTKSKNKALFRCCSIKKTIISRNCSFRIIDVQNRGLEKRGIEWSFKNSKRLQGVQTKTQSERLWLQFDYYKTP
jgi:hypothetical protein